MSRPAIEFEKSSGNVFADLGLPDAEDRLAKAERDLGTRHAPQGKTDL